MGTRADFYVGRGKEAEWLGSIAYDGYPSGIDEAVLKATTEADYRAEVTKFLAGEESATLPEQGWPWPWEDSRTTDYAYAFDGGKVYASGFGGAWFVATEDEPEDEDGGKVAVFPDMSARKAVTMGKRSGLLVFQS